MGALLRFGGVIVSRVFHIVHGCIRVGLGDLAGGVIFFGFYCGRFRGGKWAWGRKSLECWGMGRRVRGFHMHSLILSSTRLAGCYAVMVGAGLVFCGGEALRGAGLPGPAGAYSEKAALLVHVDVKGVAESPVGKLLGPVFEDLSSQMDGLPGMEGVQVSSSVPVDFLKKLEGVELGELVIVLEGTAGGEGLTSEDSLLVVGKMTQILADQEALIGEVLGMLEEEQSGLSNRVAQTRSKLGVAELFEVPAEVVEAEGLPWPVGLAVGPGEGGSVLAFGRMDRVKTFAGGGSGAVLPAQVDRLLPSRGQIWVYGKVPAEAAQAVGGGSPEMGMMGDMSKVVEQVKDFGLSVKMLSGGMELDVALGCTTGEAASEMAQGVQGFVGLAKMMVQQQQPTMSGVLNRLKVSAAGDVFRLGTSVSMAELRQGVQAVRQQMGMPASVAVRQSAGALPEVKPIEEVVIPEVEFLGLLPEGQGHVRYGKLRVNNRTEKPVSTLRVTYIYMDERGSKLGEWTRVQQDAAPVLVPAGVEKELRVPMFNVPLRTAKVQAVLRRVEYKDGSVWE